MQRRTKLALIILIGLLLLLLGLYLLLSPFLNKPRVQSPPAPSPTTPLVTPPSTPPKPEGPVTVPTGTAPVQPTAADQVRVLENRSRTAVERVGSGTNLNGFLGYQDVLIEMSSAGRIAVLEQQKRMQTDHPATGPLFGLSTRSISANLTTGSIGDAQLVVTVEALQNTDAGDPRKPTSTQAKRVLVTFSKQANGSYLIDSFSWSDIQL